MRRVALATGLACLLGCGAATEEMGTERRPETATEPGAESVTVAETETMDGAETEPVAEAEAETVNGPETGIGTSPEAALQAERAAARPQAEVTVRSTTGPIRPAIARHVLARQLAQIQHCLEIARSSQPWIAGSIRAVLRVEASGSASADLETLTPELDVVLPCIDAALERSVFPVTGVSTGGAERSHIFVEVALAPP